MNIEELFEQAQIKRNNGQIAEAVVDYERVREESLSVGNTWLAAECLHMIGVALYQDKNYQEAEKVLTTAKQEFTRMSDSDMAGAVLRDMGSVAKAQKDYPKAKQLLQESVSSLKNSSKVGHLGISQVKLGVVYAKDGHLEKAEAVINEGLLNIKQSPERFFEVVALMNLGEVQQLAGLFAQAKRSLLEAEKLLNDISQPDQNQQLRSQIKSLLKKF